MHLITGLYDAKLDHTRRYWRFVERAAEILFSPDWTDAKNDYGFAGTSASNGTAGHGSSSPSKFTTR